MTTEPELPDLDIVTPYGTITRLPTSFPITDPEIDAHLDPVRFQQGFDDAVAHLARLPVPWAKHYASTTLENRSGPDSDVSYVRGYRAALYGHLRHS